MTDDTTTDDRPVGDDSVTRPNAADYDGTATTTGDVDAMLDNL